MALYIRVEGEPVPQGSVRAFERGGKVVSVAGNAGRLERWRGDIRSVARQAMEGHEMLGPAVAVSCVFLFARPKSHLRANGEVREAYQDAEPRPDIDKLVRAVLDALTGIAYRDDKHVVSLTAVKMYATISAATVTVTEADK